MWRLLPVLKFNILKNYSIGSPGNHVSTSWRGRRWLKDYCPIYPQVGFIIVKGVHTKGCTYLAQRSQRFFGPTDDQKTAYLRYRKPLRWDFELALNWFSCKSYIARYSRLKLGGEYWNGDA